MYTCVFCLPSAFKLLTCVLLNKDSDSYIVDFWSLSPGSCEHTCILYYLLCAYNIFLLYVDAHLNLRDCN